ncbi:MAG: hypothetical protein WBF43_12115 [Methylocella sp.]
MVNGRLYSSTPGVSIPVPDFDAVVLQANGWRTVPPTSTAIDLGVGIP